MAVATRYSIAGVRRVKAELREWIDQSEETRANEESRDYPNEDRLDALGERIDALQAALDALEEIDS